MRCIDADALEKEGWSLHRTIRVDKNTEEYQTKPIRQVPTIEPRKKGKWIKHIDDLFPAESTLECSICHHTQPLIIDDNYCPNCGADMREPEDIPMEYFESGGR